MDVRLSPEQRALRDSAAQIVDRLGVGAVGQLDDTERAAKLDAAVVAAGWRDLRTVDDDSGAPIASGVEAAIIAEELARGLADVAFLGPTLATELRRLTGAAPTASAETVVLTHDLSALAVATDGAAPTAGAAIDAQGASSALLLVPAAGGHDLATSGLTAPEVRVDLTRPLSSPDPALRTQPLPDQRQPDRWRPVTDDDITAWTALGLALTCADLVGTMRGAVALATGYAKERRQYGSAIGSFQAVQHLLADAFVALEGSRSVALHAAWAVDALPPAEALASAALAKAYCARAARTVCETAIQVHGGIGNTWECLAHLHLRRALLSTDLLGGTEMSVARVLDHQGIHRDAIGGARGLR